MEELTKELLSSPEYAIQLVLGSVLLYFIKVTIPSAIEMGMKAMADQRELDRAERALDRAGVKENIDRITQSYDKIADKVQLLAENSARVLEAVRKDYTHVPDYGKPSDWSTGRSR